MLPSSDPLCAVQKQRSTNYSPYFLLFGREPVLPIDLELLSEGTEVTEDPDDDGLELGGTAAEFISKYAPHDDPAYAEELKSSTNAFLEMRKNVLAKARENIKVAQDIQKKEYDKRYTTDCQIKVGDKVLSRNLRRDDLKGDWRQQPYLGPYIAHSFDNGAFKLQSIKTGQILKRSAIPRNLKLYIERPDSLNTYS